MTPARGVSIRDRGTWKATAGDFSPGTKYPTMTAVIFKPSSDGALNSSEDPDDGGCALPILEAKKTRPTRPITPIGSQPRTRRRRSVCVCKGGVQLSSRLTRCQERLTFTLALDAWR